MIDLPPSACSLLSIDVIFLQIPVSNDLLFIALEESSAE